MPIEEPNLSVTVASAASLRNAHNTSSKSLPVIELRPYQEADLKWAQHVFYSTYLNLVPNGVILRLKSPLIWGFWIALWGFFNSSIDTVLRSWPVPEWVPLALRAFVTFAWFVVAGAGLFWWVDKVVAIPKVNLAMDTDMTDPEVYHMGYSKVDEQVEMTPEEKQTAEKEHNEKAKAAASKENFLTKTNDAIVGLFQSKKSTTDNLTYKTVTQKTLKPSSERTKSAFWVLTKPNEATLRRWAVNFNYQNHGLSTILFSRAVLHAQQTGIEWIDAETDEIQTRAAEVLAKRHGFTQEGKRRNGKFDVFGEVTSWRLDVRKWVEDYNAKAVAQAKNVVKEK
ncbi:hypothetical protein BC938DRAFT_472157 [Jimgerdemannia flammicorona]|uniref:N-acetyltransferase domain-containing protein n=1 Tax=Jimgerdemannia flammicorona TaxID=994334 RepID=A0A433QU29_9FUNG|nr:hypothetical protein BC938DRAFT_472157 [Jimgerdemannia flammicorona]